jgi:hypothetical protein
MRFGDFFYWWVGASGYYYYYYFCPCLTTWTLTSTCTLTRLTFISTFLTFFIRTAETSGASGVAFYKSSGSITTWFYEVVVSNVGLKNTLSTNRAFDILKDIVIFASPTAQWIINLIACITFEIACVREYTGLSGYSCGSCL